MHAYVCDVVCHSQWTVFYPLRLLLSLLAASFLYNFPDLNNNPGALDMELYGKVVILQLAYAVTSNVWFVSQCCFFNTVADESMGGTYMTLLNTISNMGGAWPKVVIFWAVDWLSCKEDVACGIVPAHMDGYYIVVVISFVLGFIWFLSMYSRILKLGRIEKRWWSVD